MSDERKISRLQKTIVDLRKKNIELISENQSLKQENEKLKSLINTDSKKSAEELFAKYAEIQGTLDSVKAKQRQMDKQLREAKTVRATSKKQFSELLKDMKKTNKKIIISK